MELIVKFTDDSSSDARLELLNDLKRRFPESFVHPLFPLDADSELSSLFVLDLQSQAVKPVLQYLKSSQQVEYAHESKPRKLRSGDR